jgi:outer membrane lipopolysaccharide assembly protein LptE/RlpB
VQVEDTARQETFTVHICCEGRFDEQLSIPHKTVRTVVVVDFKFPVLKGNKCYNYTIIIISQRVYTSNSDNILAKQQGFEVLLASMFGTTVQNLTKIISL